MNGDLILYEGVHLGEPTELTCSDCRELFIGRWWWTPKDHSIVICEICAAEFECSDEWPVHDVPGQMSLW